jgi:hypothetical protein
VKIRGSNRSEKVHQKVSEAFGPWGVGVRTFGHAWLTDYLDFFGGELQDAVKQLARHGDTGS